MPRYKLTVAYDGSDFCGWQKQEPVDPGAAGREGSALRQARAEKLVAGEEGRIALRTVQAVLERAVREVVREPVVLTGASRTDAGVHAWGQVAAFTCGPLEPSQAQGALIGGITLPGDGKSDGAGTRESFEHAQTQGGPIGRKPDATGGKLDATGGGRGGGWPLSRGTDTLVRAVNSRLPEDVLVRAAEIVGDDFDPIAGAVSKAYSYTFHCSLERPLWDRRLVSHTRHDLDLGAMQAAAAGLVGEHDFAAFAAAGHGRRSTVRRIYSCEVVELARAEGGARRLRIDVSGNGFLYNMVRIIAGTLHEAGRGRVAPEAVGDIIASRDRRRAGPTMPPDGLRLEWVRYG